MSNKYYLLTYLLMTSSEEVDDRRRRWSSPLCCPGWITVMHTDEYSICTSIQTSSRRSGVALALVVLHLRAQGLEEGDEHPPTLS